MQERLLKCPLCKSGHFLNYKEITDFSVTKEKFIICKCKNCSLLFTNPRPPISDIDQYYDFPEYYSHEDEPKTLTHWVYNQVRKYNIKHKIKMIEDYSKPGTILDYGCGTGELLLEATQKLWKVNGIETNPKAKEKANTKLNNKIFSTIDEIKSNKKYDVITLFHVLEHLHELRKSIKSILKHLKPQGYLFIAIPNHESYDAKIYKNYWAGWDVPRHLYHFNHKAMQSLQNEFDLKLQEIRPMKFDAFYVSLLSEKYQSKTGLINQYARSILNGLKSNNKAKLPEQYSSNIYIFSKK